MFKLRQDSAGHEYVEVVPWFRVTVVQSPEGEQLRLNTVGESGRVYPGPQLAMEHVGKLCEALRVLQEGEHSWVMPHPERV